MIFSFLLETTVDLGQHYSNQQREYTVGTRVKMTTTNFKDGDVPTVEF